jgi:hypothetical protein
MDNISQLSLLCSSNSNNMSTFNRPDTIYLKSFCLPSK